MGLHQERTHPTPVDGCFGCKALGVGILGYDKPRESGWVDRTTQKKWDADLSYYKSARDQGVQPAGTSRKKVEQALKVSEKVGKAFDASTGTFGSGV